MTYHMFPYFIALNLKILFLEHATFLGFMCSVVTKAKKKEMSGDCRTKKDRKNNSAKNK